MALFVALAARGLLYYISNTLTSGFNREGRFNTKGRFMFHSLITRLAPVAALALGTALSGCDNMDVAIDGQKGVPLAELDMSGEAPSSLVLAGPDKVIITKGSKLDIDVEGDDAARDLVRFTLKNGTLGILRKKGDWKNEGTALVRVTMPAPEKITLAGSGEIEAAAMGQEPEITIAGSGHVSLAALKAEKADITIAGSGTLDAGGSVKTLDLNLAGSGVAKMDALKVEKADVTIAGSGSASFASDGSVEANILGSGVVTVIGRATCSVDALGSGKLHCKPGSKAAKTAKKPKPSTKQAAKKKPTKKRSAARKPGKGKPRKA